jgi:hypothetical protein
MMISAGGKSLCGDAKMKTIRGFILASIALLGASAIPAQAGGHWGVGINIGFPVYYRPYYPCYGYPWYYRPYPLYYYAPAPVVVQPTVAVQPAPVAQVAQPVYSPPAPTPITTAHLQPVSSQQSEITRNLDQLANASDQVRKESALQLGRLRALDAVDPLAATLAGDRSPQVREAAARGLALIGSSKALPALEQAARADTDPTVRHSAEFSIDVIRTR